MQPAFEYVKFKDRAKYLNISDTGNGLVSTFVTTTYHPAAKAIWNAIIEYINCTQTKKTKQLWPESLVFTRATTIGKKVISSKKI